MFKQFQIANFKSFGSETDPFSLKPITLIFGPNSAGKSSILHSLLLLSELEFRLGENEKDNLDVRFTRKGGDTVDLGGIKQFIHKRDLSQQSVFSITIGSDQLINNSQVSKSLFDGVENIKIKLVLKVSDLDDRGRAQPESSLLISRVEFAVNGIKFLSFDYDEKSDNFRITDINPDSRLFKNISGLQSSFSMNYPVHVRLQHSDIRVEHHNLIPNAIVVDNKTDDTEVSELLKVLNQFLSMVQKAMSQKLDGYTYLGPLRSYPSRDIDTLDNTSANWFSDGSYIWDRLLKDKSLRTRVNLFLHDQLKIKYRLSVKDYFNFQEIEPQLLSDLEDKVVDMIDEMFAEDFKGLEPDRFVEDGLRSFLAKNQNLASFSKLIIEDKGNSTEVSHRDIGIGISQILPVIVSALGNRDRTIAIEQPEIHLHPKLQAKVAALFIESYKKNHNSFILETHSEHLVKALQVEVAKFHKTKGNLGLSPNDINIIYVSKGNGKGSIVKEMKLDSNGSFIEPWPDDFFESSNQLTIERLKL